MNVVVRNQYEFVHEMRADAGLASVPLLSESVTQDVAELVQETFASGVLSEQIPPDPDHVEVDIEPIWRDEPVVDKVQVRLAATQRGSTAVYTRQFATGRWSRSAQRSVVRLLEEGTLEGDQVAYQLLMGLKRNRPPTLHVGPLEPPVFVEQSLEECGVRQLGVGSLVPDRPVLVNQRLAADAVRRCVEAGTTETGGAVLGKIVRLTEPLPETATRFVTLLTMAVEDPRHVGAPLSFTFSPAGLAEASQIGDLRGLGETVQTVFHTHGWANECGNCNENAKCPLAECNPSLQDYQLLESLFSSKATLLPIAGRKLGEAGRSPVLQVHAWRGGEMKPIRWQQYLD